LRQKLSFAAGDDGRMGRKDLFDERGAGADHAGDEHGHVVSRMLRPGERLRCALKRFGGEERNGAVDLSGEPGAIQPLRHRPELVPRIVVPHRLRVIAEIVESLAQSEADGDARRRIKARPLGKVAHAIDQWAVGFRHALHHGQLLEGARESLDRLGQVAGGLFELPPT